MKRIVSFACLFICNVSLSVAQTTPSAMEKKLIIKKSALEKLVKKENERKVPMDSKKTSAVKEKSGKNTQKNSNTNYPISNTEGTKKPTKSN